MARRKSTYSPKDEARVRKKLKTAKAVNFLNSVVDGSFNGPVDGLGHRIKSAEIILRKSLPDLQSTAHVEEHKDQVFYWEDPDE